MVEADTVTNFTKSNIWDELTVYLEARFPDEAEGAVARVRARAQAGEDLLEASADVDDQLRLGLERKLGAERAARKIGERVKRFTQQQS